MVASNDRLSQWRIKNCHLRNAKHFRTATSSMVVVIGSSHGSINCRGEPNHMAGLSEKNAKTIAVDLFIRVAFPQTIQEPFGIQIKEENPQDC